MGHERFMRAALRLAVKGVGSTKPNPAVGAVIVKNGRVLSVGYHKKAGGPHAEVAALKGVTGRALKGATLYVTLEPCSHWGRTPPCADALIRAGLDAVVIATPDPNPAVSGAGIRALKRAGIEVVTGVLASECRAINDWYFKFITTKTPLVTLKLASSLDGSAATAAGESRWITGAKARALVHSMRAKTDAVMVGAGTVEADDPRLTVRPASTGANPVRVVLDSTLRISTGARVFSGLCKGSKRGTGRLIIFTTRRAPKKRVLAASASGAEVRVLPGVKGGVSLPRVLKELGAMGITTLLIEGGPRLAASALNSSLVDRLAIFFAPMLLGGDAMPVIGNLGIKNLKRAPGIKEMKVRRVGEDILVEGKLR
jgi:diaminohydroxyphosphoribosylaminopyrimidine deaminase/5-amino-6-(5-phosphoribosylamino)uracil reductase